MAATSLWSIPAGAATYYWDGNGSTAGSGTTPAGTWGTDAFFSTTAAGTGSTFITTPASTDIADFTAGPTSGMGAFTVDVNGTQSILGLLVRQTGQMTLGATANATTLNIGASGIDDSSRTVVTGNDSGSLTINSTLNLTASQTWNYNNATTGTVQMIVNGNVTGTGDLILTTATNKGLLLNGSVNQTGALNSSGSASNGFISVTGAIGANVTGVAINNNVQTFVAFSNGTNAYGGTTAISGGILRITNTTGSATGTTAVTVSGTSATVYGTLSGTGTSTGVLTVNAFGHLAPGNNTSDASQSGNNGNFGNAGTLTAGGGGLTLNTNAVLDFDLATSTTTGNDKLSTGALTLGSALTINIRDTTSASTALTLNTPYTLLTATNAPSLTGETITTNFLGTYAGGNYAATYAFSGNNLQVTFTSAVPEPSTAVGGVLLLVGAFGCWIRQRRRALRVA